jgi:uncharacterized membrane protein YGL010W
MKSVKRYYVDYGKFHQTKGNNLSHVIGVPIIVMAVLGLLNKVALCSYSFHGVNVSPALFLVAAGMVVYLSLDLWLGLSMLVSLGILYYLGTLFSAPVLAALFVIGWAIQFIGHAVWEKKQPAFFKSLMHLLMGPVFIQNRFLRIYKP